MASSKKAKDDKSSEVAAPAAKAADRDEQKLLDQDMIANQLRDVRTAQQVVQNEKNKADEIVEKLPEFDTVTDLEGQLAAARDGLKQAKLNSQELQGQLDVLTQARTNLSIAQKALGGLLLKWTAKYQQRNVLLGTAMHEIVLVAKLGKELEDLQQPLPLFDEV